MTARPEAGLIVGWAMTPTEVVADLRDIRRVQSVTGDPVIRTGAARNADTITTAIRLIEETNP